MAQDAAERPIDLGYRASIPLDWLGRHALLKVELGERFAERARGRKLAVDMSTQRSDTLLGDAWYRFLLRCKYTLGVEAGASVIDRDGTIHEKTLAYRKERPGARFEEIEARCFPGRDGDLMLRCLSPRHLEACATRTCQVLVEGSYNGILEPGRHYIELRGDLGNLEAALDLIEQDRLREEITARAHEDIVASGRYTYRAFADLVLRESLGEGHALMRSGRVSPRERAGLIVLGTLDALSMVLDPLRQRLVPWLKRALPKGRYERLRSRLGR